MGKQICKIIYEATKEGRYSVLFCICAANDVSN
jgi:hypothetical protein